MLPAAVGRGQDEMAAEEQKQATVIIDPAAPIIDAHHHLWDKPGWRYLYPDLLADLDCGHNIRATVYVEGGSLQRTGQGGTMYRASGPEEMRPVGESEFANGVAAMAASGTYGPVQVGAGIVGFVDLPLGDRVRPVLEAHARAARFRGVRHITGFHSDPALLNPDLLLRPHLLLDPGFRAGLAVVRDMGLSFETTLIHHQLPELVDAARAFPDLTIVLCHLGGPMGVGPYAGRPQEAFADWRANMRGIAECPNVYLKVGGLAQHRTGLIPSPEQAAHSSRVAAQWRDYVDAAIELFTPARCMFETNFPVDGRHVSYAVIWNAFKRLAAPYSADERHRLLFATAREVYRLDVEP